MVTFLSLAVLRLLGAARAEDDVVAAIDARADEFAEAAGGTGLCISAFVGGSGAAVGLSQVESGPGVVFGSARSLILGTHLVFLRGLFQISLSGEI